MILYKRRLYLCFAATPNRPYKKWKEIRKNSFDIASIAVAVSWQVQFAASAVEGWVRITSGEIFGLAPGTPIRKGRPEGAAPHPGIPSATHSRDLRKPIAARSPMRPPKDPGAWRSRRVGSLKCGSVWPGVTMEQSRGEVAQRRLGANS